LSPKFAASASPKAPTVGAKLANSSLLAAFRALKQQILNLKLTHLELIEVP